MFMCVWFFVFGAGARTTNQKQKQNVCFSVFCGLGSCPSNMEKKKVNTLIFPNLESANITYKLMKQVDEVESIGPILLGMSKPVHILQLGASVDEMVNMAALAVVDAQNRAKKSK